MSSFRDLALNEKNQADYDRWWKGNERIRLQMLASQWIKDNLIRVENRGGRSGNCYADGTEVWEYKDRRPIDDDAIDAMNHNSLGQVNKVRKLDEFQIERFWVCDSSG